MRTTTNEITNTEDVIDLRDVTDRVEALESELELEDGETDENLAIGDLEDEYEELLRLRGLLDELRGNGGDHDWRGDWYPLLLIRDSHTEDYAQQTAEDIGAINEAAHWPNNCIDWERATQEFLMDYTSIEFDGVTYWYR